MEINTLVNLVNKKLAGEILPFSGLAMHLDEVIDEINRELNAKFPTFSEFTSTAYPDKYPNYDFFPDKYIRSVVVVGAAFKFYITDEEGDVSAEQYGYSYRDELFFMLRDYLDKVPEEYLDDSSGSVEFAISELPDTLRGDF